MPAHRFEDYLSLGVTEIRIYGSSSIQVMRRLRAALLALEVSVLPEYAQAVSAELDRARVEEVRRQLPSLANRQPDAYRWPSAPSGNEPIASGGR